MPEYLLSLHTVEDESRQPMSDGQMQEFMRRIGELEREMNTANALVASGRLAGTERAAVVRVEDGQSMITDGPFAETKEHLGGFYIVTAADMTAAVDWAAKTSACVGQPIEVRPFSGFEAA